MDGTLLLFMSICQDIKNMLSCIQYTIIIAVKLANKGMHQNKYKYNKKYVEENVYEFKI
ncbi:hypothetical protein Bccel_4490 [Pseudobacteroides cellulosolvens ATCC 35603 = DSM 2933]|uniref:Uncharacterized protein n=1 Tax=Pseudobacteroides cellulosolvens ATCC 35603 = DSM 2933 TaxID=398512 RepID=A0A0L6JTQ9_9FIRM|nr:hypothetical protein Bccel_4490 [Pseudobacteroides cellulosolvens ATCC 35603 = DSM 2933]